MFIYRLVFVAPSLNLWYETNLIKVDNIFEMVFDSIWEHFIEDYYML